MSDQPPSLLDAEDVATRLKVSEKHARRLMASGEITVTRLGRRAVRVTPEALEAYITLKSSAPRPRVAQ